MRAPGLTKKQIIKLLYFADKQHLLEYGRTITGDYCEASPQGHIPRNGLAMINRNSKWVSEEVIQCLARYGHLATDNRTFVVETPPNLKVFSKSDLRVLENVVSTFGHLTAIQLERLSQNESSGRLRISACVSNCSSWRILRFRRRLSGQ